LKEVVRALRLDAHPAIRYYDHWYCPQLVAVGTVLWDGKYYIFSGYLWLVDLWILLQLREAGYHLTAGSLEMWWKEQSRESFYKVVSNMWQEML